MLDMVRQNLLISIAFKDCLKSPDNSSDWKDTISLFQLGMDSDINLKGPAIWPINIKQAGLSQFLEYESSNPFSFQGFLGQSYNANFSSFGTNALFPF